MIQFNKLRRRIPHGTFSDTIKWNLILDTYPLNKAKSELYLKLNDSKMFGLLVDHLMKVARKVGVPSPYINKVGELRRLCKKRKRVQDNRIMIQDSELIVFTSLLLNAVTESIKKNTSVIQRIKRGE